MPLVAADVNPTALDAVGARGLIALPGSASVALATALAPLHALAVPDADPSTLRRPEDSAAEIVRTILAALQSNADVAGAEP